MKYIRFYARKGDLSERVIGFMHKFFQAFSIIQFISEDKICEFKILFDLIS